MKGKGKFKENFSSRYAGRCKQDNKDPAGGKKRKISA